jgi:hypothetical protein
MKKFYVLMLSLILASSGAFFISGCISSGGQSGGQSARSVQVESSRTVQPGIDVSDIFDDTSVPRVYYKEYGAVGDGVTDDFNAIIAAHAAANTSGARVFADAGATYYIGGGARTARIETDTYWGDAKFIIDDTALTRSGTLWLDGWIFEIASAQPSYEITSVQTIKKNQEKLDISLPSASLLIAIDTTTRRYIRRGENQNSGQRQTDVFVVDENGNVNQSTPIIWDFDTVSSLTAYPIDKTMLVVKGGQFTTIANKGRNGWTYPKRGIHIIRSNVVVDGFIHLVTGEGDEGAPYNGFVNIEYCTNITVQNSTFTGRKYYTTGTYDIFVTRANDISLIKCDQTNDITSSIWWGVFGSNYCKNIKLDDVKFSRFDAHMGVHNTTILNSEIGYQGVRIIGSGLLTVENTKVYGRDFIHLRDDYGSTWEGDLIIRNCVFVPSNVNDSRIIHTSNDGQWDFGYPCFMPETITIDGFVVEDSSFPSDYPGVFLLRTVNSATREAFPYTLTKTVNISGFVSSKDYRLSNSYARNNITVVRR